MQAFRRSVREVLRDNSANAMVVSAFALFAMIGGAGLATDTVQWTLWKRQLQRMADSGAISGAYALAGGANASAAATTEFGRYTYITLSGSPTIETPPTVGPYKGDVRAVRVVLSTSRTLPFSSLFMNNTPTITAEATGAALATGQFCVISLETTTATGVNFGGNTTADLGCGIATNSQGNPAVSAGGSSTVKASPIAGVGNVPASSNYQSGTTLLSYSIPQADPYVAIPMMAVPSGCNQQLSVNSNKHSNVKNNTGVQCYTDINIKGSVNMDPGIYIIDGKNGGQFNIGAQGTVNCTGCVFLLTTSGSASSVATANVNGGATLNISAPTSGTYNGIMFYQDRNAVSGTTNKINGNSSSSLAGAIYFPRQDLEYTGDSGMMTDCLQIVSRRVTFSGNSKIKNDCSSNPGWGGFAATQIRLVN